MEEQARLIERGVRCLALIGPMDFDLSDDNVAVLRAAAPEALAIPFSLNRHLSGYASHEWVIDLLRWSLNGPVRYRNQIIGLLLGYSGGAIYNFGLLGTTVEQTLTGSVQ